MSIPGLTGEELIAWLNKTSEAWRQLFTLHPESLAFPADIREASSVAGVLQHIVAVELRFVERLAELPETPYAEVPCGTSAAIYEVHEKAMSQLNRLSARDDAWWSGSIEFDTRSAGSMRASRQMIVVHLLMHSIRHYAQLATIMRRAGIPCDYMMDYLGMRP